MSGQPSQFADELRLLAGGLEVAVVALRNDADRAQVAADEFDRVVEERDELRDENARMRPVVEAAEKHVDPTRLMGSWKEVADAVRAFREGGGS